MMLICFLFCGALVVGVYFYLQQPKFGAVPEGEEIEKIKLSTNSGQ